MAEYRLTDSDNVVRNIDNAFIPANPANCDRMQYEAWLASGGVPDPYVPNINLTEYAANKRWQKEVGGITLGGIQIATDDRSKQMIMGARIAAESNPEFTTPWVANDIITVDAKTIIAISNAVLEHVQNCFSIFANVKIKIDSKEIISTEEIDKAFE